MPRKGASPGHSEPEWVIVQAWGGARTGGDAGDDEPEDAGDSGQDPAPVGDGRVDVAVGRLLRVVADLDHRRAVVAQLHAHHDHAARRAAAHMGVN